MDAALGYNVDMYVHSLLRPTKVEAALFQRSGWDHRLCIRVSSECCIEVFADLFASSNHILS